MATWHEIADRLAARMVHHAFCKVHPESAADTDCCPFCNDRAAYRAWEAKSGQTYRETPYTGRMAYPLEQERCRRCRVGGVTAAPCTCTGRCGYDGCSPTSATA